MTALKLLRASSTVTGTSRSPKEAAELFRKYEDSKKLINNFDVYELDIFIFVQRKLSE